MGFVSRLLVRRGLVPNKEIDMHVWTKNGFTEAREVSEQFLGACALLSDPAGVRGEPRGPSS